jgi:hypothetical protein
MILWKTSKYEEKPSLSKGNFNSFSKKFKIQSYLFSLTELSLLENLLERYLINLKEVKRNL